LSLARRFASGRFRSAAGEVKKARRLGSNQSSAAASVCGKAAAEVVKPHRAIKSRAQITRLRTQM